VYLTAILDWHSRYVLAWEVSVTQDEGFCVSALESALRRHGRPEIFNTGGAWPLRKADPFMLLKADPRSAQSIVGWSEALRDVVGWEEAVIRSGEGPRSRR